MSEYVTVEEANRRLREPANTGGLASENMTVWDEFAKAALQGLLSNPGGIIQANPMSGTGWVNCHDTGEVEVSRWASEIADAMMAERNKRGN